MTIDRKTADDLSSEIISLISNEEYKKHWPAAMAAMILFTRNMNEEQKSNTKSLGELFEKNNEIMRSTMSTSIQDFPVVLGNISQEIFSRAQVALEQDSENIILNAEADFVRRAKESSSAVLEDLRSKIPDLIIYAVNTALTVEANKLKVIQSNYLQKTSHIEGKLIELIDTANAAIAKMAITIKDVERRSNSTEAKGFFTRLYELFFGAPNYYSKAKNDRRKQEQ
jgi:hypothetical protein